MAHLVLFQGWMGSSSRHLNNNPLLATTSSLDTGDDFRPHQCSYCGRRFKRKDHKVEHERIHTGERPYRCLVCGRAFVQKQQLVGHARRRHGGDGSAGGEGSLGLAGVDAPSSMTAQDLYTRVLYSGSTSGGGSRRLQQHGIEGSASNSGSGITSMALLPSSASPMQQSHLHHQSVFSSSTDPLEASSSMIQSHQSSVLAHLSALAESPRSLHD